MSDLHEEVVDLHQVVATPLGWEVTCYQSPLRLILPADQAQTLPDLQRCLVDEVPVRLRWDSESLVILDWSLER